MKIRLPKFNRKKKQPSGGDSLNDHAMIEGAAYGPPMIASTKRRRQIEKGEKFDVDVHLNRRTGLPERRRKGVTFVDDRKRQFYQIEDLHLKLNKRIGEPNRRKKPS